MPTTENLPKKKCFLVAVHHFHSMTAHKSTANTLQHNIAIKEFYCSFVFYLFCLLVMYSERAWNKRKTSSCLFFIHSVCLFVLLMQFLNASCLFMAYTLLNCFSFLTIYFRWNCAYHIINLFNFMYYRGW